MTLDLNKIDLNSLQGAPDESPLIPDQKTPLQATLSEAVKVNPDSEAKLQKLSRDSGMPAFAVEGNPAEVETSLKLNQIDLDSMVKRSPGTSKFLTDWNNASVAHDNIDALQFAEEVMTTMRNSLPFKGSIENVKQYGRDIGTSFETGQAQVEASDIGVQRMWSALGLRGEIAPETMDRLTQLEIAMKAKPEGEYGFLSGAIPTTAQQIPIMYEILKSGVQRAGEAAIPGGTVGGAIGIARGRALPYPAQVASMVSGVAAGSILGAQYGARAGVAEQSFNLESGLAFNEFVAMKDDLGNSLDPQISAYAAVTVGGINAGLEYVSLAALGRTVTPAIRATIRSKVKQALGTETGREVIRRLGMSYATAVGTEATTEGLQEFTNIVGGELAKFYDKKSFTDQDIEAVLDNVFSTESLERVGDSMYAGAQAGLVFGSVGTSVSAVQEFNARQERKTQSEQKTIDDINTASVDLEAVKKRDPEIVRKFFQDMDADQNSSVYIDGVQASLYLQSKSRKEIEADPALQKLQEQAREAASLGGDVVIPVADFATDLAGTEHFDALREFMTLSAESVAPFRQEQVRQETENYVKGLVEEAEQNGSQYAESQQVYESVRQQLIDSGMVNDTNAKVMAQVVPAWATVYARKNGMTVQEAYQRSGLTIEGPQTGRMAELTGEELEQPPASQRIAGLRTQLKDRFPDVKFGLTQQGNVTTLDKIIVPEGQRASGVGTSAMQQIIDWADANGQTVALTPSADFGGNKKRLTAFYKRFGFVENKGRNKDFEISESMYRPAEQLAQTGPAEARGYYNPANSMIRLTEAADLSTFLHEFAHFMYEMELKAGSDTVQSIHNWFKRNAADVAAEANGYLGERRGVMEQSSISRVVSNTRSGITLYHGTNQEGYDGIQAEGVIRGPVFLTPNEDVALEYGGEYAIKVGLNEEDLMVDFDLPGARLLTVEEANLYSGNDGWTIEDYIDSGQSVGIMADVVLDESKMEQFAQSPEIPGEVPAGVINDTDVLNYLDTGSTGSQQKDNAIRRAVHEQFARGFETYLMEGKAPSIELRNAFRTFARWLVQVYQRIKGDLKVNLDPEMRQVFDRMLATEEQIQAAEARAKYSPLFTDATMAGMTAEEWQDYQKRQEKVKDKQTETLRDKLITELTRQTKAWWKEEKADIADEERTRLQGERVYTARNQLKKGQITLDRAAVKEMVGEEVTDKRGRTYTRVPPALSGMHEPGAVGLHPDEAAAIFGYSSGDEMLKDLIQAPSLNDAAEARAQEIMLERHGDILNDGTIEQQADEAVQSEERGRFLLHELKILSRGTTAATFERQAIKQLAEDRIARLSFREINPGKYRKAEIKSAQEAARALAEGDREAAAQAKQRQIVNYYLGIAAADARNNVTKIVDHMARYNKKTVREEIQKAGNEYWEQLQKILERFEFRKGATLRQVEQINQDINSWMKDRIEQDGDALVLTPAVLNEAYVTHWKNVPFGELQGISDSVRNIEHVARYSNKLDVAEEKRDFDALVAEWTDHIKSISSKYPTKETRSRAEDSMTEMAREKGSRFIAQMTKMPFLASWLDGGERVGMSHDIIMQRFTDALNDKLNLMDEVARPVYEMIMNRDKATKARHAQKIFIPEINDYLFGHQILAVALNTGNQSNLKKMLLGEGWANPEIEAEISFDNPKLQAILKHMTRADWYMVQKIWDQMELLYPQLAEVHRRTTGLIPPKIDATPISIEIDGETLELRGGYYPVKYSPKRGYAAEKNAEKREAETESMFSSTASIQASVTAGATSERTGFYAPILLDLNVIPEHFQEVIHFITHHDAVRQMNKLINDKRVQSAITGAVGEAEFKLLKPWLNDIAKDGRGQPTKTYIHEAFQRLRFGITLGAMGFKASTGIMQAFGLFTTAGEIGAGATIKAISSTIGRSWYMRAVRKTLGSVDDIESNWQFAVERSKVMKHRTTTMDREIRNAMEQLSGKRGVIPAVQEASMKHIALIQTYMVDLPTWHAAYDKMLSETGDETRAVNYADWAVENLQGSGATKDMAAILRSQDKIHTTFTMFMTFFSSLGNLSRDTYRGARSGKYSVTSIAAKLAFFYALPVFFEMLMRGDLDEPDDEDERLQKYLSNLALYPVASVPFVRDAASGLMSDYGYNINPAASVLERGIQGYKQIGERMFTDDGISEITKGAWKGAYTLTGAAAGIPGTGQVWATGEHLYDVLVDGEDLTIRELLFGPDRD